jgi:hypothetical protein
MLNERLVQGRAGAGGLRQRLPRGHLRVLRAGDQRHGPRAQAGCTTCELRMRTFKTGQTITIEPFRAKAFPVIKDLMVDRSAFDRIIRPGGYNSVNAGSAPDANAMPVPKPAGRGGHGRGDLHRLRRLRGRLPERLGQRCSPAPRSRTSPCCPRASRSGTPRPAHGRADGRRRLRRLLEPRWSARPPVRMSSPTCGVII